MKRLQLLLLPLFITGTLFSQQSTQVSIAIQHVAEQAEDWGLKDSEGLELRLSDQYTSKHNGVTHVYFNQQFQGVDIEDAYYNANLVNDEVIIAYQSFVNDFETKIQSQKGMLTAQDAVAETVKSFGIASRSNMRVKEVRRPDHMIFDGEGLSHIDIQSRKLYSKQADGTYRLAWEVEIEPVTNTDIYKIHVDAASGDILNQISLTTHCAFPSNFLAHSDNCELAEHVHTSIEELADGSSYSVFPIPFESPNHTAQRTVSEPADPVASPYGWHDSNGAPGNETTWTQGNNVHAFIDRNGDFIPNEEVIDGGSDLIFDFAFDPSGEPGENIAASVTNLFYMNNIMHDFAYQYGFDEAAGNFQDLNHLTGTGSDGDGVVAHAQFGAATGDPDFLNNANFGTPSDGGSGRMRMYVWNNDGGLLTVDEPAQASGTLATATTSDWGAAITSIPVTGEVVIVEDASGQPTLGCNDLINSDDVNGKIAMIDRGDCEFGTKALNAQEAGAIGFIICNFEEGLVSMGPGLEGGGVTIPGVFISNSDCAKIRVFAGDGLIISLVNQADTAGAQQLSGSFDNGIVAHEYGHGISNRLTGGPSAAGCLVNYDQDNDSETGLNGREEGEQMGEGWSDFFTLVTTVKVTDTGDRPRGIGTYAENQDTNGIGIRPFPYSNDMSINPMTYDDIAFNSVPHGVGSVWCTMLWDLYWAFVDEYGFDEDLYTGTKGNNLAVQLVMDGMKMQPCNPGFADGRDAILAADVALTGGVNQKLIWEVFARRGLGMSADQGSNGFRSDGTEAFDMDPALIETVKLSKEMTPFVEAGEDIEVTLSIRNDKAEAVTGLVVTDVIPEGAEYVQGSASGAVEILGSVLSFELGTLEAQSQSTITYTLSSSPALPSSEIFFDDMESGDGNWDISLDEGPEFWQLQSLEKNSGDLAWGVANVAAASDVSLLNLEPILIEGSNPVLRFYHKFDTEKFYDSGILQVSTDDGFTWQTIQDDKVLRGTFSSKLPFATFAIPRINGWNGNSEVFIATVVDMNAFAGESVKIRWRFGSDAAVAESGWFIDDIELMDAVVYNSEACATTLEGDDVCVVASSAGTIVETGVVSSSEDVVDAEVSDIRVYPNPAREILTVESDHGYTDLQLLNATGQLVMSLNPNAAGPSRERINTSQLPRGFYFLRGTSLSRQFVFKVILQ